MEEKNIAFLRIMSLRGPNIWTYRPALEAWVDIGELEDRPSNTIPGFRDRLAAWLPSLAEHRCSVGGHGGFMERLREGTWAGHILEHVTLELQNLTGQRTGFGKARSTSTRGVYKVVVRSRQDEVSRACLNTARDLVMAAIEDRPFDLSAALAQIRDIADSRCLGPSTACIVDAATERRVPSIRLTEGNLVQLGHGARQRRIWTAETDRTSAIGETISRDKDLTKQLLRSCGVPVPEGQLVNGVEEAWVAAQDIGLPVVVKPSDGNHGRGVSTELVSREEIETAYRLAVEHGSGVIVERFVPGNEHRLLVVGGRLVAAAKGESAWVTGDGRSTITELTDDQLNTDPRRGITDEYPLNVIVPDDDRLVKLELRRQGFEPGSIPDDGQKVLIQRNGNVAIDVTDQVHPSVAAAVSLAARVVGLDIAGVDIVAEDISRPLDETRGAIVEVNAGPGLLMHLKPAEGKPRPVGRAIVDHLFPENETGRIPIVGVTGTRGKTAVARLLAKLIHLSGRHTGLACSDGSYVDQRCIDGADCANWQAAQRVLMNRAVEAAVFENGCRTIVAEGLAYDRCQIAVVTNIDPTAQLPEFYIETREQMVNVLRTLVDVVLPNGAAVLNAEDPLVVSLASLCDGDVIFFALRADDPVVTSHLAEGKRAAFVRAGRLVLATGESETMLPDMAAMSAPNQPSYRMENILAATAAAWALGIGPEILRAGIEAYAAEQAAPSSRTPAVPRFANRVAQTG
jgi:cyanophycin synthetase